MHFVKPWSFVSIVEFIIKRAQVGLRPCGCILSGRGLYFGTSTAHRSDESGAATLAPAMHQARPVIARSILDDLVIGTIFGSADVGPFL